MAGSGSWLGAGVWWGLVARGWRSPALPSSLPLCHLSALPLFLSFAGGRWRPVAGSGWWLVVRGGVGEELHPGSMIPDSG